MSDGTPAANGPGSAAARAVEGLARHSAARSAQARKSIVAAIRALKKERAAVNVNAVARRAGVTRKTIYAHPDLLEQIAVLRAANGPRLSAGEPSAAEDTILAALRHQLRTQQAHHDRELDQLKTALKERDQALAAAHGEIRRLKTTGR